MRETGKMKRNWAQFVACLGSSKLRGVSVLTTDHRTLISRHHSSVLLVNYMELFHCFLSLQSWIVFPLSERMCSFYDTRFNYTEISNISQITMNTMINQSLCDYYLDKTSPYVGIVQEYIFSWFLQIILLRRFTLFLLGQVVQLLSANRHLRT